MGRRRAGIFLTVFGIILAIVVGAAVFTLSQQAAAAGKEETESVIVVLAPIPERTVISATSVGVIDAPRSVVPPSALKRIEDAVGKMTLSNMYPGDWVLSNRIADTKGASGRSFTIEPGEVIVTFPASDIITATGAVKTGDYVDVLITVDTTKERDATAAPGAPTGTQGPVSPGGTTQMTMQNLRVLNDVGGGPAQAAGSATQQPAPSSEPKFVLFAVSRQDALILKQLKDYPGAKLEFALRAAGDNRVYSTEAVSMRGLIDRFEIRAP